MTACARCGTVARCPEPEVFEDTGEDEDTVLVWVPDGFVAAPDEHGIVCMACATPGERSEWLRSQMFGGDAA